MGGTELSMFYLYEPAIVFTLAGFVVYLNKSAAVIELIVYALIKWFNLKDLT